MYPILPLVSKAELLTSLQAVMPRWSTPAPRPGDQMIHFKAVNIGFALFLISAQALAAATYYVAPGGDDANPGTIELPWATISQAVGSVAPGDAVILRDGVYGPEGSTGFPVWITQPGSPNAWIVLKAEHKGGAVLDCQSGANPQTEANPQTGCNGYIYLDSGTAYWVFQDLVIRHGLDRKSTRLNSSHDQISY